MKIHNQPFDGPFGEVIKQWLNSNTGKFYGISAFAKNSGVLMLENSISNFRSNGGTATFIVGIDLDGTSIEALKNLFRIGDALFVVHSENNITFHSKIYALKTSEKFLIAVGSNNLTKGGLFNNYESSLLDEFPSDSDELPDQLNKILSQFTNTDSETVIRINSNADIDALAKNGYIRSEIDIQKDNFASPTEKNEHDKIFGTEKVIKLITTTKRVNAPKHKQIKDAIAPIFNQATSNQNDVFWFETGKMTGGSRNILDLSKEGKLQKNSGSAQTTIYYKNDLFVKGGVLFFGLNPERPSEKEITINYDGVNYSAATIKYAPNNSNWRIQIKGEDSEGKKITEVLSAGSMVNKILVFEKVDSEKYILMVYSSDILNTLKDNSVFWATNGRSRTGRKFGYIVKKLEE